MSATVPLPLPRTSGSLPGRATQLSPPRAARSDAANVYTPHDSASSSSRLPGSTEFQFPEIYHFRPFFTLQPTPLTRSSQLNKWSSLILSYCQFHRLFRVSLSPSFCNSPLFHNAGLRKRLKYEDIVIILDCMSTKEGGSRCEWLKKDGNWETTVKEAWIWWQYPGDWADAILAWVEGSGQKGVVFTVWELREGESTLGQDFHNMDPELLQRVLGILVKRGKAQIFGGEGEQGVKFF